MKTIIVKDMTCMHCFQTIQRALIKDDINAQIDLAKHTVTVKEQDLDKAIVNIKAAGFTPKL